MSDNRYIVDLPDVIAAEKTYIAERRKVALAHLIEDEDNDTPISSDNTIGLALSGGGMRSAVFNLGVVQALAKMGLFSWVDYMTTVSGGGYLGTCLTALLSLRTMTLTAETTVYPAPYLPVEIPVGKTNIFSKIQASWLSETTAPKITLPAGLEVEVVGCPWWYVEVEATGKTGWVCGDEADLTVTKPETGWYIWDNPATQSGVTFQAGSALTIASPPWYRLRYKRDPRSTEESETGWVRLDGQQPQLSFKFDTRDRFPFKPDFTVFAPQADQPRSVPSPTPENVVQIDKIPRRNHQLYHLRLNGNFIIPRRGWLKQDTLRAIGAIITGIAQMSSIFMVLFVIIAALHFVIAGLLAPDITRKVVFSTARPTSAVEDEPAAAAAPTTATITATVPISDLFSVLLLQRDDLPSEVPRPPTDIKIPPPYWFFLGGGGLYAIFTYVYIRRFYQTNEADNLPDEPGLSKQEYRAKRILIDCSAVALIVIVALTIIIKSGFVRVWLGTANASEIYWLWMPATFMIGAWIVSTFFFPYFFETKIWHSPFRSTLSSWQGLVIYGLGVSLAAAILALPYYIKFSTGEGDDRNLTLLFLSALLSAAWSYFLAGNFSKGGNGGWQGFISRLPAGVRAAALNTLVVVLAVSLTLLFGTLFERMPETSPDQARIMFNALTIGGPALVGVFVLLIFVPNPGLKDFLFRAILAITVLFLILNIILLLLGWFNISTAESRRYSINSLAGFIRLGLFFGSIIFAGWFLSRVSTGLRHGQVQIWAWAWKRTIVLAIIAALLSLLLGIFLYLSGGVSQGAPWSDRQWISVFLIGILATLIFVLINQYVDLNRISFHYFYRDRLTETFLRTNVIADQQGLVIPARNQSGILLKNINPAGCPAPYHLLMTTLNLPGSKNLTYKDSKSEPFIFSRFYCGSNNTSYMSTYLYRGGLTRLARIAAISGAAVSATLGQYTFFGQAFIMTMLNVRLGYWMDNPRLYDPVALCDRTRAEDFTQLDSNTSLTNESNTFWAKYLWYELSGTTRSHKLLINLSDGGHTDNLALYPLLQRRCKVIIVSDAGADPTYVFSDMARLIRRVNIEENIKIDIDLDPLRADPETGLSRRRCVVGRITYYGDDAPQEGWLVYFKPAITGHEEGNIKAYWWTHQNDHFPHQTTADQFYDDDQFEAYRRLGELTVEHTIAALRDFYGGYRETALAEFEALYKFQQSLDGLEDPSLEELLGRYNTFRGVSKHIKMEQSGWSYATGWAEEADKEKRNEALENLKKSSVEALEAARQKTVTDVSKSRLMTGILDHLLAGHPIPEALSRQMLTEFGEQAPPESAGPTDRISAINRCLTEHIIPDLRLATALPTQTSSSGN